MASSRTAKLRIVVRNHPALKGLTIPRTGRGGIVGLIVTKTLVIGGEPGTITMPDGKKGAYLRAYDKKTGEGRGRGADARRTDRFADDLHAERQAIYRRGGWRRRFPGRISRIQAAELTSYQAIIIGGGHNGLVTAAYLARPECACWCSKSRELVGGCAVTEEIWPGYRVSTASYLASLMQEKVVRDLELERFGYRVDAKDPAFFSPFPDGRHLFMWQDRAKTLAEIAKFSQHDAEAYPRYEAHLEKLGMVAESLLLTTPPDFPPQGIGDFIDYLKLMGKLRGLSRTEIVGLVKVFTQSAADFLDDWFECEEIKVTLATDGVIGANGGPRSPGQRTFCCTTAWAASTAIAACGVSCAAAWARSRTPLPTQRARAARRSAPMRRSRRSWSRTAAPREWCCKGGEEIHAPIVASNLDPRRTFLHLVDEAALPADFVAGIRRFRSEGTSLKMNLALSGLPEFTAFPGAPGPQHRATMHLCPSIEYVERAWDDAKYGRPSRSPLIEMTIPTMYDASLAPPGHHIMGIFLQYAPYTLKGTDWDTEREPYADRVLEVIAEYCPNIRDIVDRAPDPHAARSGTPLRPHRRQYFSWRNVAGSDVRDASAGGLGELPNTRQRPVSMRFRRASRRRRDGRAGTQCRARNSKGSEIAALMSRGRGVLDEHFVNHGFGGAGVVEAVRSSLLHVIRPPR